MKAYGITDVGHVRKINEDSLLVLPESGIFAVADGMGGHQAGEVASQIAVKALENKSLAFERCQMGETADFLVEVIHNANMKIMHESRSQSIRDGMGTTLSALILKGPKAIIGHVGDSRVYLWRDEKLTQLTQDHSHVAELVRMGELTPEEAKDHPKRNIISRALGMGDDLEVDNMQMVVNEGDVFFLATDGVTNFVDDEEIAQLFSGEMVGVYDQTPWKTYLELLGHMIMARGAGDNYSAICCLVEPEDLIEKPVDLAEPTVEP